MIRDRTGLFLHDQLLLPLQQFLQFFHINLRQQIRIIEKRTHRVPIVFAVVS